MFNDRINKIKIVSNNSKKVSTPHLNINKKSSSILIHLNLTWLRANYIKVSLEICMHSSLWWTCYTDSVIYFFYNKRAHLVLTQNLHGRLQRKPFHITRNCPQTEIKQLQFLMTLFLDILQHQLGPIWEKSQMTLFFAQITA